MTTVPAYGSVESYARILQNAKPDWLEASALAIVQIIAEDRCSDGDKVARIRNVCVAAARVRGDDVTDQPKPASGERPLVREGGMWAVPVAGGGIAIDPPEGFIPASAD